MVLLHNLRSVVETSSNGADEVPGSDTYEYSHEEGRRGGSEAKRSRHESNRYQSRSSGRNRNKRRRLLGLVRALVDQAPEFLMRQLFPHETWQQEGDEGRTGANNNEKDDDDDDDGKGAETGDICTRTGISLPKQPCTPVKRSSSSRP